MVVKKNSRAQNTFEVLSIFEIWGKVLVSFFYFYKYMLIGFLTDFTTSC